MLALPAAAVIYCALVAVVSWRSGSGMTGATTQRFEGQRRKTTFHCIRCDQLYAAPGGRELCPCPRCGHENSRLRF
jgi:Zn finger protein HypA/HybF involved in hydrogenase expression